MIWFTLCLSALTVIIAAPSSDNPSNLFALFSAFVAASNASFRFLWVDLETDFLISRLNRCLLKRSILSGSEIHCGSKPMSIFISSVNRYIYSCNVSFGLCALAIRYELRCFVCKFEKFSCKVSLQSSHDVVFRKLLKYLYTAPSDFAVASSL